MEHPLIVRGSLSKQVLPALGSLAFVVVGGMMLTQPPPASSVVSWTTPAGGVAQGIVGLVSVLLGGVALALLIFGVSRPLLVLYPDRLIDARRKLGIPFVEIRELTAVGGRRRGSGQWLKLQMREPEKYGGVERPGKRSDLSDADLTLDLSLASPADFEAARGYIQARLSPSDSARPQ